MQCPKCGARLQRFTTLRLQRLSCAHCNATLEPTGMRAPVLMMLLAMAPVQLASVDRFFQFRPGRLTLAVLAAGYLAGWVGAIALFVRESKQPRLRERKPPEPEIVINLNGATESTNPR